MRGLILLHRSMGQSAAPRMKERATERKAAKVGGADGDSRSREIIATE